MTQANENRKKLSQAFALILTFLGVVSNAIHDNARHPAVNAQRSSFDHLFISIGYAIIDLEIWLMWFAE
jgi:hypothetical protein